MAKSSKTRFGVGLKLRQDKNLKIRPRWEPWPKAREIGIKGRDLKDYNGQWLDYGQAANAADYRTKWARSIIKAINGDKGSAKSLEQVLEQLPFHLTSEALNLFLADDLIKMAQTYSKANWGIVPSEEVETLNFVDPKDVPISMRTINMLLDTYLRHDGGTRGRTNANTQRQYKSATKTIKEEIGNKHINQFSPAEAYRTAKGWEKKRGAHMALLYVAILSGAFRWAKNYDWWISINPWSRIDIEKPEGRIVIWQPHETNLFIEFCDNNGFPDVADAVAILEWTGHNPIDYCNSNIDAFDQDTWILNRTKTKYGAMVGITETIRNRVILRKKRKYKVKILHDFFAVNYTNGLRFFTGTLRKRYTEAREKAQSLYGEKFDYLTDLRLQDLRDTCVTRLAAAGIALPHICAWTGHNLKNAEKILRRHYIKPLEITAIDTARKLEAFTKRLSDMNK